MTNRPHRLKKNSGMQSKRHDLHHARLVQKIIENKMINDEVNVIKLMLIKLLNY